MIDSANIPSHQRIVILGGGFAGAYCALKLEKALRTQDVEIMLIDRNNYFVFYPFLVEAGTGSLEPRHAVVGLRGFLKTTHFLMADVQRLDTERQLVFCQTVGSEDTESVHYDHLVLAMGSVTRMPDVPGLKDYGFELKSLADAVALRDRAIQMLEQANATSDPRKRHALLQFVIVGGNYTGVELAGEFQANLRRAARIYRNIQPRDCNVTLIEHNTRILPTLDQDLSDYALKQLQRRGVRFYLKMSVKEIHANHVVLSNGEALETYTTVWCAGIAPSPLLAKLHLPVDHLGYLDCERDMRVKGYQNIWGIGDCAANPDPAGKPYPATAQHAVREGAHLAQNLLLIYRGQPAMPCNIKSQGSLAALGCRTAVAKVFGLKLSGFPAWFLWRTVYLFKMPGLARKVRVALDWTLDLFFAGNFVQLGLHRREFNRVSSEELAEL